MGLSASQGRELTLIDNKHRDNLKLLQLTATKTSLAREMQAASRDYQNALSAKRLHWTNNNGITTNDISYSTLMRPNSSNMKSPVLITNSAGKIVLDSKYSDYAQMFSPDGVSGAEWGGSVRTAILSKLTGIPEEDIDNADAASAIKDSSSAKYTEAYTAYKDWLAAEESGRGANTKYVTASELGKQLGSTSNGVDLAKLCGKGENGQYTFSTAGDISSLINDIQNNLIKYFVDDDLLGKDKTAFKQACSDAITEYKEILSSSSDDAKDAMGVSGSAGDYKVRIDTLLLFIMEKYTGTRKTDSSNEKTYPLRDTTSPSWKAWRDELDKRYSAMLESETDYKSSSEAADTSMTAEQESMIKYYDDLFTAIADNGWVFDSKINDDDYLNQMFQNNAFYITTMKKNECYDNTIEESGRNWNYEYDTSLASNFSNIIAVNDNNALSKALAKYEDEKAKINAKETNIDTKITDLNTEISAINEMLESIKKMKEENIERTFKIFG